MTVEASSEGELQLVTFWVGNEEFALPISCVQEVLPARPATRVPHALPHFDGVFNLRGTILPLLNLRRRLGLPAEASPPPSEGAMPCVVVVGTGEEALGLLVDAVSEIVRLGAADFEPFPASLPAEPAMRGLGKVGGRILTLLDPVELCGPPPARGSNERV